LGANVVGFDERSPRSYAVLTAVECHFSGGRETVECAHINPAAHRVFAVGVTSKFAARQLAKRHVRPQPLPGEKW